MTKMMANSNINRPYKIFKKSYIFCYLMFTISNLDVTSIKTFYKCDDYQQSNEKDFCFLQHSALLRTCESNIPLRR